MEHGQIAARDIASGIGRRNLIRAAAALGLAASATAATSCASPNSESGASPSPSPSAPAPGSPMGYRGQVLQPGQALPDTDHYLPSEVDQVLWGYVPTTHTEPVIRMQSSQTVCIDSVSHEGILEDQGRDPIAYFGQHGVAEPDVLTDAIDVARNYNRTPRNFDLDGPHVVTGPVFVEGAQPGDVLKIETLAVEPRVPYGVVSSRHGKGALPVGADGAPLPGIDIAEVMPPVGTDGRNTGQPTMYGNISTFTEVDGDAGIMNYGNDARVRFPLRPFMGMMGVAFTDDQDPTSPNANSVPPTLGGGNIDIRLLGAGSTFYLPVFAEGALFYVGDPHMAMGDGEVALTAMEGALRGTFRLTVCKPGSGDAPSVAYRYPFAENAESWIPIGLSDPDGAVGGRGGDLAVAMRRAVVNALDFLQTDRGMDRATAYAYLSAASDFVVSQVVDGTVGVHGQIFRSHFQ